MLHFKINETVFQENDIPSFLYIIKYGEVE